MGAGTNAWHPDGSRDVEPDMREQEIEYHEPGSLVWIPTLPVRENDERIQFDLPPTADGQPQLLVYSSPEALRAKCGPQQPGIAVKLERVAEIAREVGACGVLFDLVIGDDVCH